MTIATVPGTTTPIDQPATFHETVWLGQQFEYLTVKTPQLGGLDYYGAKGWKLVSAYYIHAAFGGGGEHCYHLIRDKEVTLPGGVKIVGDY